MKKLPVVLIVTLAALCAAVLPVLAHYQASGVTAEAIVQANLRAIPDVSGALVGEITAGTRYNVIGRSEFYPWYLLANPADGQPMGWVFAELVTIRGAADAVPVSTAEVGAEGFTPAPTVSPDAASPALDDPDSALSPSDSPEVSPSPEAPTTPTRAAAVTGTILGEINVRYGPGVDFPRVGVATAGEQFAIVQTHTQLPWVEIEYPDAPEGRAWIAVDLVEVQGDLAALPSTSSTQFNLPTLTPTNSPLQVAAGLLATPVPVSGAFQALGSQIWQLMLDYEFDPATSRLGALFLMDLQTGEAVSFGADTAFSGMSLNKIAILTRWYMDQDAAADNDQAITIAEAMICSENISTNELLADIGGGNPFTGAIEVTNMLQDIGLSNTFLTAPFANDPFITPQPAIIPQTTANQQRAEPDPYNQVTVNELGGLLASIYQCAYNESGVLLETFPDQFTPVECRQILRAMSDNKIDAMFESGVPLDTRVAHKHGWIEDTHGDAAVIYTPSGDYVLVTVVHNPVWMDYSESFPLLAEISRTVYNYFNPDAPYPEIREGDGAEQCHLLGNPLIQELQSSTFEG